MGVGKKKTSVPVYILGTGIAMYVVLTLVTCSGNPIWGISGSEFLHRSGIPMMVLSHRAGWIR